MFTGIITDIGTVRAIRPEGDPRYVIATNYDTASIALGASISCDGVCLTVIATDSDSFTVQVSVETLARSTIERWRAGARVNLERALRAGDELGGHIVSGHVDSVAHVVYRGSERESRRFVFEIGQALAPFLAPKGSVTINGVSLTVNEVDGGRFGVNIIPHTQSATTFGDLAEGDWVNVEIDMLARYVARFLGKDQS